MKTKKKLKWKNLIILILFFIFLIGLIISGIKIYNWIIDSSKTQDEIKEIQEITKVVEIIDTENTEIIEQIEEIPKANPYWDYIKMNLINVDFNELKTINDQTKGWIQVNGTNINYPFVQAKDNDYYLNHTFNKSWNGAGWVFLDYRNSLLGNDKNTILYAHGRNDKTMFGSLKNILSNSWVKDANNYIVKLSTETENTLWQVFSVYRIPTTSDYIQTDFLTDNEFNEFINMLKNRSNYDFNTNVNEKDQILTLSTCYNDYDKVVLHAKLIKKEKR